MSSKVVLALMRGIEAVVLLCFVLALSLCISCSGQKGGNSSPEAASADSSSLDSISSGYQAESETLPSSSSEAGSEVLGLTERLPQYDELTSNIDFYIGREFQLNSRISDTDYDLGNPDVYITVLWPNYFQRDKAVIHVKRENYRTATTGVMTVVGTLEGVSDRGYPQFYCETYTIEN